MAEATYELRLRGAVSSLALSTFEEMDLRSDTVVSGVIQDQAALHGLLERIRDLGLELVDVHRITIPGSTSDPEAAPADAHAEPSQPSQEAPWL
jgi:hypothetical protein